MDLAVPSLRRICVLKIVEEIRQFCHGVSFEDLGKYRYVIGPFEYLSSPCIETIFHYLASTRQLNQPWLSLLLVTHLRSIDLTAYPSVVNTTLFRMILQRCRQLEQLVIPNCKKIPNGTLCEVLQQNPSLLHINISNKLNPKVDACVVETLAQSCRHLTILKLSDYRAADPTTLLVLCGKRVADSPANNCAEREEKSNGESLTHVPAQRETTCTGIHAINNSPFYNVLGHQQLDSQCELQSVSAVVPIQNDCEKMTEQMESLSIRRRRDCLGNDFVLNELGQLEQDLVASEMHKLENKGGEYNNLASNAYNGSVNSLTESENEDGNEFRLEGVQVVPEAAMYGAGVGGTREERENALSKSEQVEANGNEGGSDSNDEEDLYEDDVPMSPLVVDDHSAEFGCLNLETLWLDNVNITDPVAAVLMQNLPQLRDLNLSDTDICNPWRLLKPSQASHLRLLCHLDVKSTALSRTALEMVPKFHPDLQKFSISSTTLPPHTYANIGRLTGVADLELIGGQFYPCEPEEIFRQGIAPAVCGIGKHLCSLNLTYFAHIEFEVIVLNCPKIEQLDLSFTGISLTYPCASLGACCPHLTTLNLAYCHIDAKEKKRHENDDPPEVSQERVLECMIGQPPNLEELHLNGLSVPDAAVKGVFPGLSHPLRVLDISRCKLITIAGVVHIWERCPHMQSVNMTNCKAITLADYQRFEARCFKERPRFRVEGRIEWK